MIRSPQATGFYPSDPAELRRTLESLFSKVQSGDKYEGGIVPHAGYVFSGMAAASLYACLKKSDTVIILGNDHYGNAGRPSAHSYEQWGTPLGKVDVDQDLADQLDLDRVESYREHSIEVQLPFLQHLWGDFAFLPITIPKTPLERLKNLGEKLRRLKLPIVATTDFSHYVSRATADRLDGMAIDKIIARKPDELLEVVEANRISMCGLFPTLALMYALHDREPELLMYYTSGDVTGDEPVVGYASIGFK